MLNKLLTAAELAKCLRMTTDTIHAWHRRSWIPCLRAGRRSVLFDAAAVEKALAERAKKEAQQQ